MADYGAHGLGNAAVELRNRGRLTLTNPQSANGPITLLDGKLGYLASNAAGGHRISAIGVPSDTNLFTGSISVGSNVASVGADSFTIGANTSGSR